MKLLDDQVGQVRERLTLNGLQAQGKELIVTFLHLLRRKSRFLATTMNTNRILTMRKTNITTGKKKMM
jgi:hypothetical protein